MFSTSDSDAWGVDLLDEETTVACRDSHSFLITGGVKYNLIGVDENDDESRFNMTIDPKAKKESTSAIEPSDLKKAKSACL